MIPLNSIKRIMIENNPDLRISEESARFMKEVAEKNVIDLSKRAGELAQFGKRRTIKKCDIEMALK